MKNKIKNNNHWSGGDSFYLTKARAELLKETLSDKLNRNNFTS